MSGRKTFYKAMLPGMERFTSSKFLKNVGTGKIGRYKYDPILQNLFLIQPLVKNQR
jgi:hypothetical protein